MEPSSVDAIVTDPPYGLEFMGKEWDRLGGDAGTSKPGIGERTTEWPAFGGSEFGGANPTCATCGGRARGARRCACVEPDWRIKGKPLGGPEELAGSGNESGPQAEDWHDNGGRNPYARSATPRLFGKELGAHGASARAMQEWHYSWAVEALRVLKPGGYLLAFGGSRTYHRLACAVEDAGFEIRDRIEVNGLPVVECSDGSLAWWYGSGFPKSLNVERAVAIETCPLPGRHFGTTLPKDGERQPVDHVCAPTPESEPWHGYGTAAKPAHEPIVVARKPLVGTVAANVQAYGTGALNIEAARVAFASAAEEEETKAKNRHADFGSGARENRVFGEDLKARAEGGNYDPPGRWPANVVLVHSEDCVLVGTRAVASDGHFPSARPAGVEIGTTGHAGQDGLVERNTRGETQEVWECVQGCPVRALNEQTSLGENAAGLDDSGGASRFFYTAKTSRAERNAGLEEFEERALNWSSGDQNPGSFQGDGTKKAARNFHPTVKPIDVMRWLVKLVTPRGGLVLDPFMGSGTTGAACVLEGFEFVGVEKYPRDGEPGDPDYFGIAEARIAFWREHGEDGLRIVRERDQARAKRAAVAESGQLDLGV